MQVIDSWIKGTDKCMHKIRSRNGTPVSEEIGGKQYLLIEIEVDYYTRMNHINQDKGRL